MDLLLIRHAQPLRVEKLEGAADPALTDLGHRQAAAMAGWLAEEPFDAIYVSPLVRARQTARPLGELHALEPIVVDGLAEFDRDERTYIPIEEMKNGATPADRQRWLDLLANNNSAGRRAWRAQVVVAVEELVEQNRGRRIAAVCHGGVINAYTSHVMGIEAPMFFEPEYTSVHRVLAASSGVRSIVTLNEAPFLRGLPTPGVEDRA